MPNVRVDLGQPYWPDDEPGDWESLPVDPPHDRAACDACTAWGVMTEEPVWVPGKGDRPGHREAPPFPADPAMFPQRFAAARAHHHAVRQAKRTTTGEP